MVSREEVRPEGRGRINLHLLLARLVGTIPAHIEYLVVFFQSLNWHWHVIVRRYNLRMSASSSRAVTLRGYQETMATVLLENHH